MTHSCRQCGVALPGHTAAWLCPKCLLQQAATPTEGQSGLRGDDLHRRPHHFGDYELIHEIARGGMGVVYKARQISLNRVVALKMLLFGRLASEEFARRFRAEAAAAASLQHPNIVSIHEVGEHDCQQYFSMAYVEGSNLSALVRENSLPAKRAASYVKTIAEAIHYAHSKGILHRDLKPSNVIIDANDQPRVTDFGLAKKLEGDSELTLTGQVLGTPGFMSPEQAGGKGGMVGPSSDVYSLGALLYFLLTKRAPFVADSLEETLRQIHEAEPVPPRRLDSNVPRDLEIVCVKCLSKEPHKRYATARDLADDLGHFLNDEPITARPVSEVERLARWCRRKPTLAGLLLALFLVGAMGLSGILWQWRRAQAIAIRLAHFDASARILPGAATLIDLRPFYNGGKSEEFVGGIRNLAGIDFDAGGWIHLDVSLADPSVRFLPKRVNGIVIGHRCHRLHFLQTAVWMDVPMGMSIGNYLVHYEDDEVKSVPIIHGRDVRDYTHLPQSPPDHPSLVVAWRGESQNSREHGGEARLYKSTWENPRPNVPIRSIDFVHGNTKGTPILVAVTTD